ncbi:MAG: ABC transporter ATP-binding protein [Pseudanabaenaceae cyanobacterium bins.68]|nr:ABC transporter ATP-binding protein [Pseudanabaenaceae cyanobacterium bins.68]
MAQLKLDQVVKCWQSSKGTEQVGEISLEVKDGEFLVLVGASGCGKSTVLRLIAGLDTPTSGNIYIGDRLVNQVPARQRDVAMVFQNYALYPHMTVAENLTFGLKMRQADPKLMRERLKTVAKALNLEPLLQRKPSQLSGGQQQRVALGRAMARSPQLFLLDEPLSNLDTQLRDQTRAELKLLHQQLQTTTIYVTHDQVEAMTLGDRLVMLDRGKICQVGTPLEIYQNPQNLTVASFLGSPKLNLLTVIYQDQHFMIGDQAIPCPWSALSPGQYILGLRPEQIRLDQHSAVSLKVQVLLTETLGSEVLVRTSLAQQQIQFKLAVGQAITDYLEVSFEPECLLLFSTTGDRLR